MNDINENEITVIISTLNVANQIEKTILSYLGQDFKKKNLIIVDGNSSDHTVEIIKKYSNNLQYWVSENDDGIYDAWNKAIRNTNMILISIMRISIIIIIIISITISIPNPQYY